MFEDMFSKNSHVFVNLRARRMLIGIFAAAIWCLGPLVWCFCLLLRGAPGSAQSCSFNCNTAETPDEVMICQRADLCRLDIQMSALYFSLRNSLTGARRSNLVADQSQWLRDRIGCGGDYACLNTSYQTRVRQLQRNY
jgi:uncharacterized protein